MGEIGTVVYLLYFIEKEKSCCQFKNCVPLAVRAMWARFVYITYKAKNFLSFLFCYSNSMGKACPFGA
uniref:Uncharacterized protein n=1 Tax=Anguilla anguilla TaxID=7936 RepID=A0A0E9TYJ3_ANGAN